MSSDHPAPRRLLITLKSPARKPKAPDRPKIDELDRGFDHWFAQARELNRQADAYYQELAIETTLPLRAHVRAREGTSSASKWTGTRVPRNAGFPPMILPINRSLVGASGRAD
jgi:hypothetical protein